MTTAVAGLLLVAATGARAEAQTGSVTGTVYDSISGAPLADAAVFLWDTPHRAVSDEEGRYRIDDVPPGTYNILYFHRRLGEMGVSAGPRLIEVQPGQELSGVELATPSRRTLITTECLAESPPEGAGIVAGWVEDGESGLRLGGSEVALTWNPDGDDDTERITMRAGQDGWFHTCSAPRGVPMVVGARFYGRQSHRREVTVREDGFVESDLSLDRISASTVSGRLLDDATGQGVDGASVWLRGTDQRASTNRNGYFDLGDVDPGTYMMRADHLAYGQKMDTLVVPSGLELTVEMRLDTRPIPIAPLTVAVERHQPISAGMAGGIVISREQIDPVRQQSRDASDVIRSLHIPGVLVSHQSNGRICVGYSTGQVKMNQNGCVEMMIYINDVRATDADMALRVPPDAIERMVIYKPVEAGNLFGLGGGNGVWMIYTRGN